MKKWLVMALVPATMMLPIVWTAVYHPETFAVYSKWIDTYSRDLTPP